MTKNIRIQNLKCPKCSAKIQAAIAQLDGVKSVDIDFDAKIMKLDVAEEKYPQLKAVMLNIAKRVEPNAIMEELD